MTFDIYSHAFPDAERDATATLDRLFGPTVAPQVGEGGARELQLRYLRLHNQASRARIVSNAFDKLRRFPEEW